jgi:serine protease Do
MRGEPRARLGVISEKDAKGAKLTEVMPESAAAKAGLKEGDIITAVDGKKVDGPESLSEQIRSKKPGQESEISYLRDKKTKKMKVKLGTSKDSLPNVFYFNAPQMEKELADQFRNLDKQHRNMDQHFREMEREFRSGDMEKFRSEDMNEFRREMELMGAGSRPKLGVRIEDTEDGKGVRVIDVQQGYAAEKAGFKKDDILTHIDDKKITNTDQAREMLRDSRDKSTYPVTVQRNGQPFNMTIKTPKEMKKADL